MIRSVKGRAALLFVFITLCTSNKAQDELRFFNFWKYYADAENALYNEFCTNAFQQLEERKAAIARLQTTEDWIGRQEWVRRKMLELAGPFPEKTPLNTRITGVLQRDGYRVEKLIYESMPGYYVTAALFIPDGLRGRNPAILHPIGHSVASFRRDTYQHTILNLVTKGFIVLAYDPVGQGERLQYYDESTGKSRFGSTHEHSYPGAQCFISGYSPARYFIWDGIRGIDLLLSRREVDPARIGMTGLSGGGTSTAQVMALDDRILAAAPECYITNFNYLLRSRGPQDAEQNIFHFIREGLDHADFIEVRAPKPTLIISNTRDFFSIQGARETFMEARKAYRAMGAGDHLQMTEEDSGHGYTRKNREAMYAFFQRHLDLPGDATDQEVEIIPASDLQVTATGQAATSLQGETIFTLNRKLVEEQQHRLESARMEPEMFLPDVRAEAEKISGFDMPDDPLQPVFSGRYVYPDHTLEKYMIEGSGDYMLPLLVFLPASDMRGVEAVLLLHEKGKAYAAREDPLQQQLLKAGHAVFLADLPGTGELGPGYLRGDAHIEDISYNQWFAGILTGKSVTGLRAEDIVRIVRFISEAFPDHPALSVVASGTAGPGALHAASFNADIDRLCLIDACLSYAEIAMTRNYEPRFIPSTVAGALKAYDLPDLMAGLHPRPQLIINPLSADGSAADQQQAGATLRFPIGIYARAGDADHLRLMCGKPVTDAYAAVVEWLKGE